MPAWAQQSKDNDDAPLSPAMQQMMDRRVKNANHLLVEEKQYKESSQKLHAKMQNLIAESKTLKGEAQVLHTTVPLTGGVKLDAAQLKSAQGQYAGHINEFKAHAQAYQAHLADFAHTLGECHANEAAYKAYVSQVQLHVSDFHISMLNIRPPHVCGLLPGSTAEAAKINNQLRVDAARMQDSETSLALAQTKLTAEQQVSGVLDSRVAKEANRQEKEKELAGEFGKLREEYDLLKTEKDILAKNGGGLEKITRTSVAAKVK
jgi:hypothetical protein